MSIPRLTLLCVLLASAALPSAALAAPQPLGHACTPQNGVRFCPTTGKAERIPTWDGAGRLDVDVTLPATGEGPFPTIVMLHGYGGSKRDFEATNPEGRGGSDSDDGISNDTNFRYNNNFYARQGYAVVNYTARGFGAGGDPGSCSDQKNPVAAAADPGCARGYIRLADGRFEVRDTQELLGRLVDEGITRPDAIGVTGISYGGGQSMQLAYLRNRIRNRDGSFSPWRSPGKGTPLSITAAYPRWPWSDLAYSLVPNGRFLDFGAFSATQSREPIGVPIQSYVNGLYLTGKLNGYYCGDSPSSTPCNDPDSDINSDFAETLRGEPATADTRARLDRLATNKSAVSLPGTPAPLLMQSGFTDDLFPISETLRIYNRERARDPRARVALQFGDLGHSRGSNKDAVDRAFNEQGAAFFAAHLRGQGSGPAPGSVTVYRQTCPRNAPAGRAITAPSWPEIHPGAVRFGGDEAQTVSSTGGNPDTARQFDPIAAGPNGTSDACRSRSDETAPGTAIYRGPTSTGFTLLGRPTVTATIQTSGPFGQLATRLWDVAPDGSQVLASRGVYRLLDNQSGRVTFQLTGNGYRFAAGHRPKLEVLGRDAVAPAALGTLGTGYLRPSNSVFSVRVSNLSVELPTAERPDGEQIVAPAFARARLRLTVSPARATTGRRTRFRFRVTSRSAGTAARASRGATVRFAGRTVRTGADGRATLTLRLRRAGRHTARASRSGERGDSATVRAVQRGISPRFTG